MSLRLGNNIIAGVLSDTSAFATKTELNTKADTDLSNCTKPYIKTTYTSGESGYRIWSDGYCEQWGRVQLNGGISAINKIVTFIKKYNLVPNVIISQDANVGSLVFAGWQTTEQFNIGTAGVSSTGYCYWKASGYLASGQY